MNPQTVLRLVGGLGLIGLGIVSCVAAISAHADSGTGLEELGVLLAWILFGSCAVAFLSVGLLAVFLRRHRWVGWIGAATAGVPTMFFLDYGALPLAVPPGLVLLLFGSSLIGRRGAGRASADPG